MESLVEKLYKAFISIVMEYLERKGIDVAGVTDKGDLGEETVENFSIVLTSMAAEKLLPRVELLDDTELRKNLFIYLLKSAVLMKSSHSNKDVLGILEVLHSLFSLSNYSLRTVNIDGTELSLHGFNGWRSSQAGILIQDYIFNRTLGIPDDVSCLSWTVIKAVIETKFEEVNLLSSKPAPKETSVESPALFSEMQEALLDREATITSMQAKLAEETELLFLEKSRYQLLLEDLKKLDAQNKHLKVSVGTYTSEMATMRGQITILQEQLELQQTEIASLQKKLKERDKVPTFPASGITRTSAFHVSSLVTQPGAGIFASSAGPSILSEGTRHRKTGSITSPGKR